jgi:uncharacterized hydrophobic protein (TIGR00341 family)
MALRLVEMTVSAQHKDVVRDILGKHAWEDFWQEKSSHNKILVKFILPAEDTEAVLDAMEKRFAGQDDFKIALIPVEASIPRIDAEFKTSPEKATEEPGKRIAPGSRISREELYSDIRDLTVLSRNFVFMVVLSTLVATIGIARNNVAIIIGAMVIAPLLGPNMAFSLASALGDTALGRTALKTGITGILIATGISVAIGAVLTVDPDIHEISSRIEVGLGDIVLALAAGAAGALAFTTGMSAALIGVMVAVALLPPLVTAGLLLGSGQERMAFGAFLLFSTNMICVNLAGVATFLAKGVRPLTWWEAAKAKKATYKAILLWGILLAALVVSILLSREKIY